MNRQELIEKLKNNTQRLSALSEEEQMLLRELQPKGQVIQHNPNSHPDGRWCWFWIPNDVTLEKVGVYKIDCNYNGVVVKRTTEREVRGYFVDNNMSFKSMGEEDYKILVEAHQEMMDPSDGLLLDDKISFGQYKGKNMRWIIRENPRYVKWLQEKTGLKLRAESSEFYRKRTIGDYAPTRYDAIAENTDSDELTMPVLNQ